jgi:hypothetical protein
MPTSEEIRREIEIRLKMVDLSKLQDEQRRERREGLIERTREVLAQPVTVVAKPAVQKNAFWPPQSRKATAIQAASWPPHKPSKPNNGSAPIWPPPSAKDISR